MKELEETRKFYKHKEEFPVIEAVQLTMENEQTLIANFGGSKKFSFPSLENKEAKIKLEYGDYIIIYGQSVMTALSESEFKNVYTFSSVLHYYKG